MGKDIITKIIKRIKIRGKDIKIISEMNELINKTITDVTQKERTN